MPQILWERDIGLLRAFGEVYQVTSLVRNELNERRPLHDSRQIVTAVLKDRSAGPPVMPRPFPKGKWFIVGLEMVCEIASPFYPVKILTNAHQQLQVWAIDDAGGYDKPLEYTVDDYGYWLHAIPTSKTTQGCGKIGGNDPYAYAEALRLAGLLYPYIHRGQLVMEVV